MPSPLSPGQPLPWFHAAALEGRPDYAIDTVAGRWVLMLFAGMASHETCRPALELVAQNRALFDDRRACFFGVTTDPADAANGQIAQHIPGIRWLLDYDRAVSVVCGASAAEGEKVMYRPHWLLLDPLLRVHRREPIGNGAAVLDDLRERVAHPLPMLGAPVLTVPGILPPELCRRLIQLFEAGGGRESGFMREENGITVEKVDHGHKRRADYAIDDEQLIGSIKTLLTVSLRPMIQRAFQFDATRIERWIVACYDAQVGGHFRPHRDNTTKGTAHRKFACTINLNAEDYDGGDLRFPEFGPQSYRAPTGGAVVFSCSLLHEAMPVTRGRRYAFLPFFYDEDGARLRERNLRYTAPELQNYRSGLAPESTAASPPD